MKKINLLTKSNENIWHYHPIGTGTNITYISSTNKLVLLNVATGLIIDCLDIKFNYFEQFKDFCLIFYLKTIENSISSLDMSYYDKPTYVGLAKVEVDFNILKN